MRLLRRPALGLLGQVVAILLITLLIEFGASTILYERASSFAVRDDEANRLAEHLVISRRLIGERAPAQRDTMAAELTTDRYALTWSPTAHPTPRIAPALDEMQRQVIEWEPSLRDARLTLQLLSPGRRSVVTGGMRLNDGSWVYFRTREPLAGISFTADRKRWGEFHVRLSRMPRGDATVMLKVGDQPFLLVARDGWAWSRGPAQAQAIIDALRTATAMRVESRDGAGVRFTDPYLLDGAPTAIDAAAARCALRGAGAVK